MKLSRRDYVGLRELHDQVRMCQRLVELVLMESDLRRQMTRIGCDVYRKRLHALREEASLIRSTLPEKAVPA